MVLPTATAKPNRLVINNAEALPYNVDVSATQWNNMVSTLGAHDTVINALLHVSIFDVVIPENSDHEHLHHNLGEVPMAVVCAPVDDVGRCWYDMNTLTATDVDICVANPPMDGGYLIRVILYY